MSEQSERMLRAAMKDQYRDMHAEIERLRAGLQLIANDKNRLMNEVARQTAASILGGKPIGEVPEWPTREEAEKRAAELMAIGRATLAAADSADDEWHCSQYPGCECFAGCREKALEAAP